MLQYIVNQAPNKKIPVSPIRYPYIARSMFVRSFKTKFKTLKSPVC